MSLIHTLTSTPTHTCAHERYLYIANEKSKGAKHIRTKDRNPFRVTSSMFMSVTLATNILVSCGGSAPWESDLHILQCEEVSDSQLKAHHSQ